MFLGSDLTFNNKGVVLFSGVAGTEVRPLDRGRGKNSHLLSARKPARFYAYNKINFTNSPLVVKKISFPEYSAIFASMMNIYLPLHCQK